MQPDLYRETIIRMLRATNLIDNDLGLEPWSEDHEKLSDTVNVLREALTEFRGLLTDLDEPEAFAGQFDLKLREMDMHLQGVNTALNQLRSQAFDLQIGINPHLTSHMAVDLSDLAAQLQKDYETVLLDERDRDPALFMLHDSSLNDLLSGQGIEPDRGFDL